MSENGECAIQNMKTFGPRLKHISLRFGSDEKTASTMCESLADLLSVNPPQMKLQTFSCLCICLFDREAQKPHYHRIRAIMVNAFSNFFAKQSPYLTEVSLNNGVFSLEELSQILRGLATHNATARTDFTTTKAPASLTVLKLYSFFVQDVAKCPEFCEAMGGFSALKKLKFDSLNLTDDLLERLSNGSPLLESVFLVMGDDLNFNHTFPSTAGWLAALQRCPKLQVLVKFKGWAPRLEDFKRVLAPGMPLANLHFTVFDTIDMEPEAVSDPNVDFLAHLIQHFANSLKTLTLGTRDPDDQWSPPRELEELVSSCPSLTCLSLLTVLPVEDLLRLAAAHHQATLLAAPSQVALRIVLGEGNRQQLGNRDLARLAANLTNCSVQILPPEI